jgi:hypothetical protein
MSKISIHQNKLELGDDGPQENESFPFALCLGFKDNLNPKPLAIKMES